MVGIKTKEAAQQGRPLFPYKVRRVEDMGPNERVLKDSTNKKLGKVIRKGVWKGYRIKSLTLAERTTCPTYCIHWVDCFGNNMRYATRYEAGPALEMQINSELSALDRKGDPFALRLHVLGDFYSIQYIDQWHQHLLRYRSLHVFGFTALRKDSVMGRAIDAIKTRFPDRFRVRWSGQPWITDSALSLDDPLTDRLIDQGDAIACPEQEGKTESCASCALCWHETTKAIAFATH